MLRLALRYHTIPYHTIPYHRYVTKRIPSYCDRVLYKSLPGFEPSIRVTEYEACTAYDSSDHKPVRAGFVISDAARGCTVGKLPAKVSRGVLGSTGVGPGGARGARRGGSARHLG